MDWLADAIKASAKDSMGPLPPDPKFGDDVELVPEQLVKQLTQPPAARPDGNLRPHPGRPADESCQVRSCRPAGRCRCGFPIRVGPSVRRSCRPRQSWPGGPRTSWGCPCSPEAPPAVVPPLHVLPPIAADDPQELTTPPAAASSHGGSPTRGIDRSGEFRGSGCAKQGPAMQNRKRSARGGNRRNCRCRGRSSRRLSRRLPATRKPTGARGEPGPAGSRRPRAISPAERGVAEAGGPPRARIAPGRGGPIAGQTGGVQLRRPGGAAAGIPGGTQQLARSGSGGPTPATVAACRGGPARGGEYRGVGHAQRASTSACGTWKPNSRETRLHRRSIGLPAQPAGHPRAAAERPDVVSRPDAAAGAGQGRPDRFLAFLVSRPWAPASPNCGPASAKGRRCPRPSGLPRRAAS